MFIGKRKRKEKEGKKKNFFLKQIFVVVRKEEMIQFYNTSWHFRWVVIKEQDQGCKSSRK